jgi:hypothetical protein
VRRLAVLLPVGLVVSALLTLWLLHAAQTPTPALIAGLPDDGLRGAPCPARSLYEQKARLKQGVRPPAALGEILRTRFPLGTDAGPLEARLKSEGFDLFAPCPNDDSVLGARWMSRNWGQPDAYVYWRADDADKLIFLDGYVSKTD